MSSKTLFKWRAFSGSQGWAITMVLKVQKEVHRFTVVIKTLYTSSQIVLLRIQLLLVHLNPYSTVHTCRRTKTLQWSKTQTQLSTQHTRTPCKDTKRILNARRKWTSKSSIPISQKSKQTRRISRKKENAKKWSKKCFKESCKTKSRKV